LKIGIKKTGYNYVVLTYCNGNIKSLYVHRLVAFAFFGKFDLYVNHINSNRTDNRVENIEYVQVEKIILIDLKIKIQVQN
jgi:hypothetical protein